MQVCCNQALHSFIVACLDLAFTCECEDVRTMWFLRQEPKRVSLAGLGIGTTGSQGGPFVSVAGDQQALGMLVMHTNATVRKESGLVCGTDCTWNKPGFLLQSKAAGFGKQ